MQKGPLCLQQAFFFIIFLRGPHNCRRMGSTVAHNALMDFKQLLELYRAGKLSETERAAFEELLHNEASAAELAEAIDEQLKNTAPVHTPETQKFLYQRISEEYIGNTARPRPVVRLRWLGYAAAVLVLCGASLYWWWSPGAATGSKPSSSLAAKVEQGFLKRTNYTNSIDTISLEDGSVVSVYPGATLAYPKQFAAGKREIYLEGEAFFKVSKQANRPFFVYNNHLVTQVLGTSFGIRSKNGQIEVAVQTGKVAVYENKEQQQPGASSRQSNGVIITPNQRVTYFEAGRHFVTSVVEQPRPVPAETDAPRPQPVLNYNETALSIILKDLENAYALEIELENEQLKNCPFTGDLSGQNLFHQLEGICLVFDASYEVKGTRILLKGGKQCK